MGSEKFGSSAKSGYDKGTIRNDIRYLGVSKDVRRHRLISISYITTLPCHGRGREFESRRPRHFFSSNYGKRLAPAVGSQPEGQPEDHLRSPIWILNDNFNRVQILPLGLDLLYVHRMNIAGRCLLLFMAKH